jgi:hypothetical protein
MTALVRMYKDTRARRALFERGRDRLLRQEVDPAARLRLVSQKHATEHAISHASHA